MTKDGLLFDWPGRHHLHLLLPTTLLAAIAAHAGLFFLFSIIYPRPDAGAIDSRSVYIVLPGSEESARLSALLESADPSVFAPGRGLPTGGEMAAVEYTPHYETVKPMVEEMPVTVPGKTRLPLSTGPVLGNSIRRAPVKASSVPTTTKLRADEGLTPRVPEWPEELKSLNPAEGTSPATATFLVAIRPEGTVAHVFPQQRSGSAALDQRATDLVRSLRFLPGTEDPAWGILTLDWGGQ